MHLYGQCANMDAITDIADKYSLYVVEDAAQAHGSTNKGKKAGTLGIAAGIRFYSTKVITTGEGGMVTSNNSSLIERVAYIKNQSVSLDREYWHEEIGYNYRMTNICAAIGLGQLKKAKNILIKKREVFKNYYSFLKNANLQISGFGF